MQLTRVRVHLRAKEENVYYGEWIVGETVAIIGAGKNKEKKESWYKVKKINMGSDV